MLEIVEQQPAAPSQRPPLLFVHGIMHGAWCWEEHFLPYFAQQGYPSYAVSLRGHGSSSLSGALRWVRVADYVADALTAAEQVAQASGRLPVLIGHSMGGLIVQKCLEQRPAAGAVLLATVPVGGALRALLKVTLRHPREMLAAPFSFQPALNNAEAIRWMFFSSDMPTEAFERYRRRLTPESFRAILDLALFDIPRPSRAQRVPTLVVHAGADTLFTKADSQRTAAAYRAAYRCVPAAHDVMLDPAWQQTADIVYQWLEETL
ncbi:alpha/beta fold hydrolase [Aggregatilineales bacterium SYSU G02658]